MDGFFPSLVGAAIPVAIGIVTAVWKFGKLEEAVANVSANLAGLENRTLNHFDTIHDTTRAIEADIRESTKMQHENFSGLGERIHSLELVITDRISRVEGLIEAPKREA